MGVSTTNSKVPVRTCLMSGTDKSHEHYTSGRVGQLIPLLVDELLPNTKISLGALANVSLPPFACEFNGKIDYRVEAFFVPTRLLWQGIESFLMRQNEFNPDAAAPTSIPTIDLSSNTLHAQYRAMFGEDGDLNYIMSRIGYNSQGCLGRESVLPAMAYERVWSDWYRDARLQKASFAPDGTSVISKLPWTQNTPPTTPPTALYYNGHKFGSIRQRNYDRDYFTTALTSAANDRANEAGKMFIDPDDPVVTVGSMRMANLLQKYFEDLGNIGNDFANYCKAAWGCFPETAGLKKSVYLGQSRTRIYSNTSENLSNNSTIFDPETADANPWKNMQGARTSNPFGTLSDSLVDSFTTKEHGYLVVLGSIVPILPYGSACNRFTRHTVPNDFGDCRLAGLGNQPIMAWEISTGGNINGIFGYTDRYAEYKILHDRTTGALGEGASLDAYAPKRSFTMASPQINTSFIEIPVNALWAVQTWHPYQDEETEEWIGEKYDVSRINVGFTYKVVQPLPAYSIPSLCDHENCGGNTYVDRAGVRL